MLICRPNALGNPFLIGRDGDRTKVVESYRLWLWMVLQEGRSGRLRPGAELKQEDLFGVGGRQKRLAFEGEFPRAEEMRLRYAVWVEFGRLVEMVRSGETVRLVCHCAPQACHGDVVRKALEWWVPEEDVINHEKDELNERERGHDEREPIWDSGVFAEYVGAAETGGNG